MKFKEGIIFTMSAHVPVHLSIYLPVHLLMELCPLCNFFPVWRIYFKFGTHVNMIGRHFACSTCLKFPNYNFWLIFFYFNLNQSSVHVIQMLK